MGELVIWLFQFWQSQSLNISLNIWRKMSTWSWPLYNHTSLKPYWKRIDFTDAVQFGRSPFWLIVQSIWKHWRGSFQGSIFIIFNKNTPPVYISIWYMTLWHILGHDTILITFFPTHNIYLQILYLLWLPNPIFQVCTLWYIFCNILSFSLKLVSV